MAKDQVHITYETRHGTKHNVPLKLPVRPGHGEAIINEAERRGAVDLADVRAQVARHYV